VIGAVFVGWTSLSLFSVLESAFNIVYGRPNRSFLHGKALALVLLVTSLVTLFVGLLAGSIERRATTGEFALLGGMAQIAVHGVTLLAYFLEPFEDEIVPFERLLVESEIDLFLPHVHRREMRDAVVEPRKLFADALKGCFDGGDPSERFFHAGRDNINPLIHLDDAPLRLAIHDTDGVINVLIVPPGLRRLDGTS